MRMSVSSQLLHDLRSPLNQIIGYSEMLSEDEAEPRRARFVSDLGKVSAAGHRMLELIEEHFTALPETIPPRVAFEDNGDALEAELVALHPESGPVAEPGRLLVVDDAVNNRDVLSRRLRRQGHEVETVSSGAEALELMRADAFDLVLLDILMPDMDGYEVLGHIKADPALQHIPVIMISALNELQSVVRCIEAGAEDYLAKPFDPTLLKARIGACLEKKRGRDRETQLFEQLQDNYKRLQEAEKLRDEMRNMIVHDLRTPLTSVIVGVQMLENHGSLTDAQREVVGIATMGGRTLLAMINDLLDVEKMEAGSARLRYDVLSAAELVSGAIAQVTPLAHHAGTTLVTDFAPALPLFAGDGSKLSRTLVNLVANAIHFTAGGTVTIGAVRAGECIRFEIRDDGAGIPEEAFERIFEKFGQVDPRNKSGTGLGLAFCKLVVEAHSGRIEVASTPGAGSTFSFTIPLVARSE